MSDGKNYGLKFVNQSADEIIAEMQRKFSVIIERLQTYDRLNKDHADLRECVDTLCEKLEKLSDSSSHEISRLEQGILNLSNKLQQLDGKIPNVIESINNEKSYFNSQIESVFGNLSALSEKHLQMSSILNNLSKNDQSHHYLFNQLSKEISEIKGSFNELKTAFNIISDVQRSYPKQIQDLKKELSDKVIQVEGRLNTYNRLNESFEGFKRSVNDSMDSNKIDLINGLNKNLIDNHEKTKSIREDFSNLKSECKNLISDNFLDIKNSQIKFENINKQICMIEKKLENVNLLLKKHELDK